MSIFKKKNKCPMCNGSGVLVVECQGPAETKEEKSEFVVGEYKKQPHEYKKYEWNSLDYFCCGHRCMDSFDLGYGDDKEDDK